MKILVADVELDLALEDVERVRVPAVEVRVDAASRVERDLEQGELGSVGLQREALAGRQRDRLVHSDRLLRGHLVEGGARRDEVVVRAGVVQRPEVVPPAEARSVHGEKARATRAREPERVHGAGRHVHPATGGRRDLLAVDGERHLALEHAERLAVTRVEVQRRRGGTCIGSRGGDAELGRVREQDDVDTRTLGDQLSGTRDHEARVAPALPGRRVLIERHRELGVVEPAEIAVEAHSRRVEVEEAQVVGAVIAERVHDVRGNERKGPGAEDALTILERQRQRAREDVEAVDVLVVDVELRPTLAGGIARLGDDQLVARDPDADESGSPSR